MMANDDMLLVREYAATQSEQAFQILVRRYLNLVYSVALRQAGDPHLAEEITQAVFVILARKAKTLSPKTILSGWLCRTARFVAANLLTTGRRRQIREHEAYMQSLAEDSEPSTWLQIAPLLEAAMTQLGELDHNAIVLRFYEGRSLSEVGVALGTSEAAAKKRVMRALERLKEHFRKQGVTLSVGAISIAISAHSVQAAPIGLATSVTVAAAHGTAVTTSTLNLINTTLKIMAWTKIKTGVALGLLAILAAGTATVATRSFIVHQPIAPDSPLANAGFATPEASLQSIIQAAGRGDIAALMAIDTPNEAERIKNRFRGKSDDQIKLELAAMSKSMADVKISKTDTVSDDEVHLLIEATPPSGGSPRTQSISFRKIGSQWKFDGEAH